MKKIQLGVSDLMVSNIALGAYRMGPLSVEKAMDVIQTAIDSGINFFDHADRYAKGEAETIFGEAIKRLGIARDSIIIQSKCGIHGEFFDFSKEHIIASVNGSLERLQMDYLDVLVLHRPDALMEPKEVAAAFKQLKDEGKVRWFGVSNQNQMQIELLKSELTMPLIVNQLQMSLKHTPMIDAGLNVNMGDNPSVMRDGGNLEYARLHNMTVQPWSPFYSGFFEAVFVDNDDFKELNDAMRVVGEKYGLTNNGVAIAWLLRHPASMQPIIGTMTPQRIRDIAKASEVVLTREEWYRLYKAAGNRLP